MGQHQGQVNHQGVEGSERPAPARVVAAASGRLETAPEVAGLVREMMRATALQTVEPQAANSVYSGTRAMIGLHKVQQAAGGADAPPVVLVDHKRPEPAAAPISPSQCVTRKQRRAALLAELASLEDDA